jgi:hypothetical protein
MAIKESYKIPHDLNASYADMEIAIQSKDGVGLKPLPIKVILSFIGSGVLCFWLISKTFVADGSLIQQLAFGAIWIALTAVLISYDKTRRMKVQMIPTLLNYLPKASRHVLVRRTNPANDFLSITRVKKINENGMVEYTDGSFGYYYRITGSASILLFDKDKEAIIQRVDSFFRKIGTNCVVHFVTVKEPQKVYRQVAALSRKYDRLGKNDDELRMLANDQFDTLQNYVGTQFKSIHQYLVIKADNKEALSQNKNVLQAEVENSSRMLKSCVALYKEDIEELLGSIYKKGVQS